MVDWLPNNQSEKDTAESEDPVDTSPTEFVQWMGKDHNQPPLSLQRSPFFSDICLSVEDECCKFKVIKSYGLKCISIL